MLKYYSWDSANFFWALSIKIWDYWVNSRVVYDQTKCCVIFMLSAQICTQIELENPSFKQQMIGVFYLKTQEIYFMPQKMNSLKDRYRKSGHSTCFVFESEIWKPHCLSQERSVRLKTFCFFHFAEVDAVDPSDGPVRGRSVSDLRPETETSLPITSDGSVCLYPVFGRSRSIGDRAITSRPSFYTIQSFFSNSLCRQTV